MMIDAKHWKLLKLLPLPYTDEINKNMQFKNFTLLFSSTAVATKFHPEKSQDVGLQILKKLWHPVECYRCQSVTILN